MQIYIDARSFDVSIQANAGPGIFFSADFSEISPETGNLATHPEMQIPLKKIR
jgi:hypothetical protein